MNSVNVMLKPDTKILLGIFWIIIIIFCISDRLTNNLNKIILYIKITIMMMLMLMNYN